MNVFEECYAYRDNPKIVSHFLSDYLTCEIYSPVIIRQAKVRWRDLPFYVQETVHPEIRELIQNSAGLTNAEIQNKIYAHTIARSAKILLAYSNCKTPLTQDPTVKTFRQNFLSAQGKAALKQLLHATTKQPTYDMYELALKTGHKFLMDPSYYLDWTKTLRKGGAEALVDELQRVDDGGTEYLFPILQLTKGCVNRCSHCEICAKPHLSHMPYPMWRALYQGLSRHYSLYEQAQDDHPEKQILVRSFDRFYADSDPASYYDPIMRVDSGDVATYVQVMGGHFLFQTKGITTHISRRAIAKAVQSVDYFGLSFVDTPLENKKRSFYQLKKTIRLIEKIPERAPVLIDHLHLKSGPTVPESNFFGYPVRRLEICDWGRAKENFKSSELRHEPNIWSLIIEPNGDIVSFDTKENKYQYYNSFLKGKFKPVQISETPKNKDILPVLSQGKDHQR